MQNKQTWKEAQTLLANALAEADLWEDRIKKQQKKTNATRQKTTHQYSQEEKGRKRERDTRDVSESLERKREGGGFVSEIGWLESRESRVLQTVYLRRHKPLFEKKVTQEEFEFFNGAFSVQEANVCMCPSLIWN